MQILNGSDIVASDICLEYCRFRYLLRILSLQILYTIWERYENFEGTQKKPKCRTLGEWLRTLLSSCRILLLSKQELSLWFPFFDDSNFYLVLSFNFTTRFQFHITLPPEVLISRGVVGRLVVVKNQIFAFSMSFRKIHKNINFHNKIE